MSASEKTIPESGWDAFGKEVPSARLNKAYEFVKEILPKEGTDVRMAIVGKTAKAIEKDEPYSVLGSVHGLDPDLAKIDLTGRYRLMAILMTD